MSVTDGLMEEELHKIVASGADGATDRDDGTIIEEASRRARGRAGLMTTNAQNAEAMDHWEAVLTEIRDEEGEPADERSAADDGAAVEVIDEIEGVRRA
jgi:hypothetical protein